MALQRAPLALPLPLPPRESRPASCVAFMETPGTLTGRTSTPASRRASRALSRSFSSGFSGIPRGVPLGGRCFPDRYNFSPSPPSAYYQSDSTESRIPTSLPVRTPDPDASDGKSRVAASTATSYLGGNNDPQNIFCAVSEARGISPSVGIAFIDVSNGEVCLSQICDSQFYVKTIHKIQVREPSKILVVSTACPPSPKSTLYSLIEESVPGLPIVPLDRGYWSETSGLQYINTKAIHEDAQMLKVALQGNFYATCSLAAVRILSVDLPGLAHTK
jgi:hypothetical protein